MTQLISSSLNQKTTEQLTEWRFTTQQNNTLNPQNTD